MKIWHPFTQEKTAPAPIKIVKGKDEYLFDESGKRYIDMVSSWWVNILGHSNHEIAEACANQAKTLEHVIFAGFSHEPAERLVDILSSALPDSLSKFFFSDNGSTAVEVALKMSYQYFQNKGVKNKNVFINLEGAYHGDTLGAMSAAGNSSEYHSKFKEFFFQTFSIKFPNNKEEEENAIYELEEFLKDNHQKVCSLIIEPLVQGAAGMKMYTAEFLDKVVEVIRQYDILVIFDEVMTGFFRTGTMFAMDQVRNKPDIVCLSKALTGGFLPLSLTVTTEEVYEAFLSDEWEKAFIHGHSYTANPIACAAACKAQELLKSTSIQENIRSISRVHKNCLSKLSSPCIVSSRTMGTIAALDLKSSDMAKFLREKMFNNGIIIRPIKNTVYFIPPYCISEENLEYAYNFIGEFLKLSEGAESMVL